MYIYMYICDCLALGPRPLPQALGSRAQETRAPGLDKDIFFTRGICARKKMRTCHIYISICTYTYA